MLLGPLMGFPGVSWDLMGFTMEKTHTEITPFEARRGLKRQGAEGREALTPAGGSELPPMPGPMGDPGPPPIFFPGHFPMERSMKIRRLG